MAINSVNDPGFLAQLAGQAAQKSPLARTRATNAAIGAGRSGASAQIPAAMQTQSPYFLNPGANPAMQSPLAIGPGGSSPLPDLAGPATRGQRIPGGGSAGGYARPQGTGIFGEIGDDVINAGRINHTPVGAADDIWASTANNPLLKAGTQSVDDVLLGQAASGARAAGTAATAGNAAGAATNVLAGQAASKLPSLFANVTKGTLMRGGGVAALGYAVSGMADGMNIGGENSDADQGISGGIMGAGMGAGAAMALGLGAGPVGWAALGGAALFAGGKMLFGDNKTTPQKMQEASDKTRSTIQELGGMYGLEGDQIADLMMQYDVSTRLYLDNKDKDGLKNYLTGLSASLPALMLQQKEQADLETQEAERYEGMLATQAQFAPIFGQALNQAQTASAGAMATANEVSQRLEGTAPNLANLVRSGAATSNDNANRLYAGYAQQMAMGPAQQYNTQSLNTAVAAQDAAVLKQQLQQQNLLDQYMQAAA